MARSYRCVIWVTDTGTLELFYYDLFFPMLSDHYIKHLWTSQKMVLPQAILPSNLLNNFQSSAIAVKVNEHIWING